MSGLNIIPFDRVLYRPHLTLGGERHLVIVSATLCFCLFLSDINLVKGLAALLIWTLSVAIFRLMGKIDPYLSLIYLRSLKYRAFYPAHSRL